MSGRIFCNYITNISVYRDQMLKKTEKIFKKLKKPVAFFGKVCYTNIYSWGVLAFFPNITEKTVGFFTTER